MSQMKKIFETAKDELLKDMIKKAEAGDVRTQYNLGWMYANGRVVLQDDAEAVKWYRLAAEAGLL